MPLHSQPLHEHNTSHTVLDIPIENENDNIDDDEDSENGDAVKQMFAFAGLQKAVSKYTGQSGFTVDAAISDDMEAEQQSMGPEPDDEADFDDGDEVLMDVDSNVVNPIASLSSVLAGASTGVTEGTESHYKSLMKQCEKFLREHKFIKDDEDFFCDTPRVDAPELICAWILDACDSFNLDGSARPETERRSGYSHAQKMRASATYGFGRLYRLGNLPWHKSEVSEKMLGNPSVSQQVSLYMVSLRRRKVHAGEEPTSARAITEELIEEMYNFGRQPEYFDIKPFAPQSHKEHSKKWGGPKFRRLLHFVYTISFVCLLRIDEALKIRMKHIQIINGTTLKLTLPFRKTNQFGDIKPFYIKMFPEEYEYLCPVRALMEWLRVSRINSGYICRKISKLDEVHDNRHEPMTSQQFLEGFRQNLLDVHVDPSSYGGHSFRRGGCQWLSVYRRWPLRKICEWGGWSTDFSHLTIVKYLISWNDDPMYPREDFFNFDKAPATYCSTCGRSCDCYGL